MLNPEFFCDAHDATAELFKKLSSAQQNNAARRLGTHKPAQ